ncbi:protein EXPRESSION OF TERPENOIDS 1-like [Hibiscus syriacus]|uniref:protein EXPRESSION OF TERPENOIDS 1-like n=1 Tax=Hibiscus syriacus TaxID=106335 RepID=UPI001922F9D3|nr:protein EXPRESSION OF TERPENOIDS 1-like [Hibiscus syriacus]
MRYRMLGGSDIETNNLEVSKILNLISCTLSENATVADIKTMLSRNWEVRSKHISREINITTNILAKMIRDRSVGEPVYNESPRDSAALVLQKATETRIFITFSLKTIPIVATPTTYTTTKTWPPPLPSHDHNHHRHHPTSMLGLHNIFLVAPQPPPTSQESHQPQQQQPSSPPPPPPPPPQAFYQYYNLTDTNIWTAKRSTTTQESLPVFQMKDGVLTSVEEDDEEEDGGGGSGCFKVCRDCGNRAKKECRYSRCRTCCKSRGYDCATHVKSTWVPAARKKDRKVVLVGEEDGGGSSGSSSCGGKRQRVLNFTSNAASKSLNFEAATSQDSRFKESLPGQVRAPAVFRCIQVTAISDGEAEVAYQATVNISGHVFKGFLYDHGVDVKNAFPCISNVVFESSSNGREKERDSSSPIVDPPNTFAASSDRRSV